MDTINDRFTRPIYRLLSLALAVLVVFLAANVSQPGVTLAAGASKMYWTDHGTDKIQRANLDGSSVEDLVTTGLSFPYGIALDIQSSTPVPAASEWGLIALAVALVVVFVWGYMRRSAVLPRQL